MLTQFKETIKFKRGFPGGASDKEAAANAGDLRDTGLTLGWEDPLEDGMATHSSILAWRIPGERSLMDYSP